MTAADPLAILAALGVDPPRDVTPVAGGWDTALWRVDAADGQRYALRVFRPDQAKTCRKEALVMRTLFDLGLSVPAVTAEGVYDDRPALIMRWITGRPLLDAIAAQPWQLWRLGTAMGREHARIHRVEVSDALAQALPRIDMGDTSSSILHMDYHPLNVMTDGWSVTGVLDWANVGVGDRRADLARTVTLLRLAPTPPGTSKVLELGLRTVLEAAWRSGYLRRQPTNPFRDNEMDPFYAWAGEWTERDLCTKLGRPGVWLREQDLDRIHRWTIARRERTSKR